MFDENLVSTWWHWKGCAVNKNMFNQVINIVRFFSETQESELGNYLTDMSKMYYGLTVQQLRKLAYQYAKINKIQYPSIWDTTQQAGRDWYRGFLERNRSLSLRTPEATSMSRATASNSHCWRIFCTFDKTQWKAWVSFKFIIMVRITKGKPKLGSTIPPLPYISIYSISFWKYLYIQKL